MVITAADENIVSHHLCVARDTPAGILVIHSNSRSYTVVSLNALYNYYRQNQYVCCAGDAKCVLRMDISSCDILVVPITLKYSESVLMLL